MIKELFQILMWATITSILVVQMWVFKSLVFLKEREVILLEPHLYISIPELIITFIALVWFMLHFQTLIVDNAMKIVQKVRTSSLKRT